MSPPTINKNNWTYTAAFITAAVLVISIYGGLLYLRFFTSLASEASQPQTKTILNGLFFTFLAQSIWYTKHILQTHHSSSYKIPLYRLITYGALGTLGYAFYSAEIAQRMRDDAPSQNTRSIKEQHLSGWASFAVLLLFIAMLYGFIGIYLV